MSASRSFESRKYLLTASPKLTLFYRIVKEYYKLQKKKKKPVKLREDRGTGFLYKLSDMIFDLPNNSAYQFAKHHSSLAILPTKNINSSTVKPEIATIYFDSRNHGAAKASSTHLAETLFSLFDENNHPRKPCRLPRTLFARLRCRILCKISSLSRVLVECTGFI